MPGADWSSEYALMIADCEARQEWLSEWEAVFLDSLSRQIAAGRAPSQKQLDVLDRIWDRVTKKG